MSLLGFLVGALVIAVLLKLKVLVLILAFILRNYAHYLHDKQYGKPLYPWGKNWYTGKRK